MPDGVSGLRGDYSAMADDYSVAQRHESYSPEQHALWRRLHARQSALLPGYAAPEFAAAAARLDAADGVPDLARASALLFGATRWRLVPVPGLIPDDVFFRHLAARQFPVTVWLRRPEEADYLVEPDIFHDFFGHVPMLFDPVFADALAAYGSRGIAADAGTTRCLARFYWYTVEFGLIGTAAGLRAYGAGLLSSKTETVYAVSDPRPLRVRLERERVMRTDYRIDRFQETYFVIDRFDQLFAAMAADPPAALAHQPPIAPGRPVDGDRIVPV